MRASLLLLASSMRNESRKVVTRLTFSSCTAPAKKAKTAAAAASTSSTVKKPVPPQAPVTKALPSFKKGAPKTDDALTRALATLKAAKTSTSDSAASSAQAALAKHVGKAKGQSESAGAAATTGGEPVKKKKKKTVRWKPDDELCKYREIEAREAAVRSRFSSSSATGHTDERSPRARRRRPLAATSTA